MAEKKISPAPSSLIERASQVYGLREAMRQPEQAFTAPNPSLDGPPIPAPLIKVASPVGNPAPRSKPVAYSGPTAQVDLAALREAGFVVPGAPPSSLSEEFRIIKRQLLINAFGGRNSPPLDKGRLVLICSAQPNEGKTFSSVNLALSMASESDYEVLLVDADVAKPEVLSTLGVAGGAGLMDVLAEPSLNIESLIVPTSVPGLSVLPAGRQINNDTELLASAHTAGLIDGLVARNPRRIVLFDSAPALAASPASVLALHVGQILLVVRADQTTESELRDALAMLEGDAHVQLMINSVTYGGSTRKFGYYYGFGE
jgi:exopolysaccharide/PEP-CTERM locus tyrosine autokinase